MNSGGPVLEPGEGPLLPVADHPVVVVSTSVMRWVRGPVSSFMSSWPRAMGL